MKKISPLGKRNGAGTFDEIWNMEKYNTIQQACKANDTVILDFVQDDNNIKYIEIYYSKKPEEKTYYKLEIQFFPFGIDMMDDYRAMEIAQNLLKSNSNK